jgi:glycosyltransferase involved in cell wall biosynthesis
MRSYCVPAGDAAAIANALAEIHGASNAELQRIGEQGRAFVLERYDVRQLNARLLAITQSAGADRRSSVTAAEPAAHYARV